MRWFTGALLCVVTMTSSAEEIRVLCGGAAKSFIEPLAEGDPADLVGRGEIELGTHQISEILPVPGVKYTVYIAVHVASSAKSRVVSDFIKHLSGAQARERLVQAGYTSPE